MFAGRGLTVDARPVASSPAQFRSLREGAYEMVLTSPDNIAAHSSMDVRVVRAVDGGMGLCLVGARGVRCVDDLRGRVIGVDVADSGFAFALYELLAASGLRRGDCEVVALGSTPRRAVALREGRCAATLLNGGAAVAAVHAGLVRLGRISDVVNPYLGTVLAATGPWLAEHADAVSRFVTAWQRAVTTLLTEDVDDLLAGVFDVPREQVRDVRRVLRDPVEGLVPDGAVDERALANVAALRARYGG